MPTTARNDFNEDIARTNAILTHASGLPHGTPEEKLLRDDLLRSVWMFAVGALDAYFCDAYVEVCVKTLRAKSLSPAVVLPKFVRKIEVPIDAILAPYAARPNWRWRMAVRHMMEKDNVLSLNTIKDLFNPFFRDKHDVKFFKEVAEAWLRDAEAPKRLFGTTVAAFDATTGKARDAALKAASAHFSERFGGIIQRRHDCIHNCDRPKVAPQAIGSPGTVGNVVKDVRFLVEKCDQHIDDEFGEFLRGIGCNAVTLNGVGY